jgi:hypothetical protein
MKSFNSKVNSDIISTMGIPLQLLQPSKETKPGVYVARKVQNSEDLFNWFAKHGLTNQVDPSDLHVTIAYSKKFFEPLLSTEDITVTAVGFDLFGDDEEILVLRLESKELQIRFDDCINRGAVFDYGIYQPHITLSYNYEGEKTAKNNYNLPTFPIILVNEYSEDLEEEA